MNTQPNIVITEGDLHQLRQLLERCAPTENDRPHWKALEEEIDRANVVPSEHIPADVVTMQSRVRIVDMRTGEQLIYRIVYPQEANYAEKKISVLAPIGMALLGCREGTEIEWKVPSGTRRLRIEAVEHQPEAARKRHAA